MSDGIWISARAIRECKNLHQAAVLSLIEKEKYVDFSRMRKKLRLSDDQLSSAILALEEMGKIETVNDEWKETEK